MKKIQFIFLCTALLGITSCKKEEPIPPDPITPNVFVPIFYPGDTSKGAAYANKLTASWQASVYCQKSFFDDDKLSIAFYTRNAQGSIRESLGMEFVSIEHVGNYKFTTSTTNIDNLPPGEVFASYETWTSDGDVLEDYYRMDSTDVKNGLVITKIDLANKRVEGTFHASYNLQEPRRNSKNPKKVTFSEGSFWAVIRD